jgi:stage V sporulation protein K
METQMHKNKNGQINVILQNEEKTYRENKVHYIKNSPFKQIDRQFTSFVALDQLKKTVKEIYATHVMNQKRKQYGLTNSKQVLHMLFKGNPGTGKTSVARELAKMYYELNILSKGHFIEAERADLVGEYIGQTAQKTRSMIQKAMGGILFVDEAYSLARGGEKDFGKEAIDTLVKQMEDHQNDFILILAGYPKEMDRFLSLNPGLKSRFPFILDFDDYSVEQLIKIANQMAAEREFRLTNKAEEALRIHLYRKTRESLVNFSNARYVRNIIEKAIRMQAVRLLYQQTHTLDDLMFLTEEDLKL